MLDAAPVTMARSFLKSPSGGRCADMAADPE
jgi:hypothetical protein